MNNSALSGDGAPTLLLEATPTLPTHEFYVENGFTGIQTKEEFGRLIHRAYVKLNALEKRIPRVTYFQFPLKPEGYARDMALCEIADELRNTINATGVQAAADPKNPGEVASIHIGSLSTTYKSKTDTLMQSYSTQNEQSRLVAALKNYAEIYLGVDWKCR